MGNRNSLTARQRQILEFIETIVAEKGYPPSVREIGDSVGLSSSSTVHGHLSTLEKKGFIRRDPTKPRAIELLSSLHLSSVSSSESGKAVDVPIVGRIAAGMPITAVENIDETFPLPWDMVRGGNCFLLEVKGDSMIEAGIHDRDLVLVRQQPDAENGEIVAAVLDDEATVKHYYKRPNCIRLVPANSAYRPIERNDIQVLGRVIGLIRRFV